MKRQKFVGYLTGITLILSGIALQALFDHTVFFYQYVERWYWIIPITGIVWLIFPIQNKLTLKLQQKTEGYHWFFRKLLTAISTFAFIFPFWFTIRQTGNFLNYQLRKYCLSANVIISKGTIKEMKKITLKHMRSRTYYIIHFRKENEMEHQALRFDYVQKDHGFNGKASDENPDVMIARLKQRPVKVIYSQKFPSFLKIELE